MQSLGYISYILTRGLTVLLSSLLLAGMLVLMLSHQRGERLLTVQTGSMVPTFRPGDVIVVKTGQRQSLRVGDIISYQSPRDPRIIITHRLIDINHQSGWLTTEGDALHTADPPFAPRLLIGRASAVVPGLGVVLNLLRRPLGLVAVVYLPSTVVIIAELTRLTKRMNGVCYRLPERSSS